jgi:hypothetical protein
MNRGKRDAPEVRGHPPSTRKRRRAKARHRFTGTGDLSGRPDDLRFASVIRSNTCLRYWSPKRATGFEPATLSLGS